MAPLPTTVNLVLCRWSCNVEPEIWKNLTPSRFRHRKTLFRVNTGIPPSSSRNAELAGLRSAASQKSRGPAALPGLQPGRPRGAPPGFLTATWPRLGGQQGSPLAPGRQGLPNLLFSLDSASCKGPALSLNLGEVTEGNVPPTNWRGLGHSGTFRFLSLWQAVKESLLLKKERRLCVHSQGAEPLTRRCVLVRCGHQRAFCLET